MLCVIPVSSHDAELVPHFLLALGACGKNEHHSLLVVCRPSDESHGREALAGASPFFGEAQLLVFPQDGPSGWPEGPNFYWASTVRELRDRGNQLPWFWCELDCTPLKKGWLDTLETEYRMTAESHPFMGVREQTRVTNASGELVDGGSHMAGTGVYPPNVHVFSHLWLFVHKMTTAFDIVIQWEIAPVLKTTTLIQHAFRTHGYTRGKDGVICGEDRNNFPSGIRFDKPLSPDAVISR